MITVITEMEKKETTKNRPKFHDYRDGEERDDEEQTHVPQLQWLQRQRRDDERQTQVPWELGQVANTDDRQ